MVDEQGQGKPGPPDSDPAGQGRRLRMRGETREARAVLLKALKHKDPIVGSDAALELSRLERLNGGNLANADRWADVAADRFRLAEHRSGVAQAKYEKAIIRRLQSNISGAEELLREALKVFDELDVPLWKGNVLCELATLSRRTGDTNQAMELLGRARANLRRVGATLSEANVELELGTIELLSGSVAQAFETLGRAVDLYRQHEGIGVAHALFERGKAARLLGRFDVARDLFDTVRPKYDRLGHELGLAHIDKELAKIALLEGAHEVALPLFETARKRYEELGEPLGLSEVLIDLGVIAQLGGDFERSRKSLLAALEQQRRLRNPWGETNTLLHLAQTHRYVGDFSRAEQYVHAALAIRSRTRDEVGRANALKELGEIRRLRGRLRTARRALRTAVRVYGRQNAPGGRVTALCDLAKVERSAGRRRRQQRYLRSAKRLADELREPLVQANVRRLTAQTLPNAQAATALRDVIHAYKVLGVEPSAWAASQDLAVRLARMGAEREALALLVEAMVAQDLVRQRLSFGRAEFQAQQTAARYLALYLAVLLDEDETALAIAETARSEALARSVRAGPLDLDTDLEEAVTRLRLVDARSDVDAQCDALRHLESLTSSRFVAIAEPTVVDAASLLAGLSSDVDILVYEIDTRPKDWVLYVIWVSAESGVIARRHVLPQGVVREIVSFGDEAGWRRSGLTRELSELLVPERLRHLLTERSTVSKLVVVPAGPLWTLPFVALRIETRLVVELAAVVMCPSLDLYKAVRPRRSVTGRAIAYLREDLPGVEVERLALSKFAEFHEVDADAVVETLRSSAGAQLVVVSAHGNREAGLAHGLDLGEGRFLRAADVVGAHVSPTVVLGACWASLLRPEPGTDVLALPTVCLSAGATAVVGALHAMPSQPSALVLAGLYEGVLRGSAPAEALRAAQEEQRRRAKTDELAEWASLAVIGAHQGA
jgi:tetratricopeptide (TPR) repeat protein